MCPLTRGGKLSNFSSSFEQFSERKKVSRQNEKRARAEFSRPGKWDRGKTGGLISLQIAAGALRDALEMSSKTLDHLDFVPNCFKGRKG